MDMTSIVQLVLFKYSMDPRCQLLEQSTDTRFDDLGFDSLDVGAVTLLLFDLLEIPDEDQRHLSMVSLTEYVRFFEVHSRRRDVEAEQVLALFN